MNPWILQLIVGSLGLALAALLAGLWLRLWNRDPLASYRLVVTVLIVTLCMPLAQWGAKRLDLPSELSFVGAWAEGGMDWITGESQAAEVRMHPLQSKLANRTFANTAELGFTEALNRQGDLGWLQLEAHLAQAKIEELRAEEQALLGNLEAASKQSVAWYKRPILGEWNAMLLALGIYAIGLLCALLHTGLRLSRTKNLLADARPVTDRDSLELWSRLERGSPLAGRVRLLESEHIRVPMCFGLGTPAVVLPLGGRGDLEPDLFSCVLLHELVHLERRDTWVMLGQEFARSLFWFHPAAWWLCNKIDLLRELSCDLLVVRRTGRRKRYATALVEYAARMRDEFGPSQAQATALLPWSSSTHQLSRRIEMLVKMSAGKPGGSRRSMFLAAGSLFGLLWGGQLATAAAMAPAQEGNQDVVELADLLDAIELEDQTLSDEPQRVRLVRPTVKTEATEVAAPSARTQNMFFRSASEPLALQLRQDEARTPTIGISIRQDDELPQIHIDSVIKGSLAEKVGLKPKDIIVQINGGRASVEALLEARKGISTGKLKLLVKRGSETLKFSIKSPEPEAGHEAHRLPKGNQLLELHGQVDRSHSLQRAESDEAGNHWISRAEHGEGHGEAHSTHDDSEYSTIFTLSDAPSWSEGEHGSGGAGGRLHQVHKLPGKAHGIRVHQDEDGETPNVFFVDEDGATFEFKSEDSEGHGFTWFADSSDNQEHDSQNLNYSKKWKLHKEKLDKLHKHLLPGSNALQGFKGKNLEQLHKHLQQVTEKHGGIYKLKADKQHDLSKQKQHHNEWVEKLSEFKFGGSDSNHFEIKVQTDEHPRMHIEGLDMDDVRLKIRDAIKISPDNDGLRIALKTLESTELPEFEIAEIEIPELENLRYRVITGEDGKINFDRHGNLELKAGSRHHTLPGSGDGSKKDFFIKRRVKSEDHPTNVDIAQGEYRIRVKGDTGESECAECSSAKSGGGTWVEADDGGRRTDRNAELDRMRALLKERQAELEQLQRKLNAMREGTR